MKVSINGYAITAGFQSVDSAHATPHTGIDLAMPMHTTIFCPTNGVVENIINYGKDNIGLGLVIRTPDGQHLILGHLERVTVKIGQKIELGQQVALSGNSGNSTGPHLHIGLLDKSSHFVDPTMYEEALQHMVPKDIPWWDLKDQALSAGDAMKEWLIQQIHDFGVWLGHTLVNGSEIVFPTLAGVGLILWMCPFLPYSDKGPKLTGLGLLVFMFIELAKGA